MIKDSANKLRSKMKTQAIFKSNQRTIDLESSLDDSNTRENRRNNGKYQANSVDRTLSKRQHLFSQQEEEDCNNQSANSPSKLNIFGSNYEPKFQSSKQNVSSPLEQKLQTSERLLLELENKLHLGETVYNEKQNKMIWNIEELEKDNICLHQLIKSKINEINDLKNENTELQRKLRSNIIINQKMGLNEEELRAKVEELMNKTTELNFLLRKKDEEVK